MSHHFKCVSCLQPCESMSELGTADPIVELSRLEVCSFFRLFYPLWLACRQKNLLRSMEPTLGYSETNKM